MITINIIIPIGSFIIGGGVAAYLLTHPEIVEKWFSIFYKIAKTIYVGADKQYVKFNIQANINSYIALLNKKVPNLNAQRIKFEWVEENITPESFLKSGDLVMRMHKSQNQNRNIVNATYTYVSHEIVKKVKTYLAPYQRDAIDLFVTFKALSKAGHDVMDTFVQDYLRAGLEKEAIDKLYAKFQKIDLSGLFYPVFITEMTFLGEKIFGKGVERKKVFKEVDDLVSFLLSLSVRHTSEYSFLEHYGNYSKFAIRIVGKQNKIENQGRGIYVRNIIPLLKTIDTLYLIGKKDNKVFIDNIVADLQQSNNGFETYHRITTPAKLKSGEGEEFEVMNYICIIRKKNIEIVVRN